MNLQHLLSREHSNRQTTALCSAIATAVRGGIADTSTMHDVLALRSAMIKQSCNKAVFGRMRAEIKNQQIYLHFSK